MERFTPILTFLAYSVTAAISNNITPDSGFAPVIWPPIGIAIAGLMLETRKTLVAIFLASVIFNFRATEPSISANIPISLSETLAAFVGAHTLRNIPDFDWSFAQTDHVVKFLLKVVGPTSIITPMIGTPVLFVTHALHGETLWGNFSTWCLGNAIGIMIFTPFVLIISKTNIYSPFKKRLKEYVLLYVVALLTCSYLFLDFEPLAAWVPNVVRRIYLLFPIIIWCAVRFAPIGTSFLLQAIAAFATYGAINNSSVFLGTNTPETFSTVQLYLGFLVCSGLLVSAHVTQSNRNEVRFRSMFEMAGVPSVLIGSHGQFKLVNDQFCNMTGYTRSELLQKKFTDITHPDDIADNMQAFKRLMAGEQASIRIEKRYIVRNGDTIWSQIDAALINHCAPEELTSIAIIQDITTRKLAEIAADTARKDAEAANQAKSEFLAFMSHEIRTPLGVILGFAEILKDKAIDQHLRDEFAETIHRNAIELGSLIDDVLDLSKVEAGRVELAREVVNISELIRDIKTTFYLAAKNKTIDLDMTIDESAPNSIVSDHKVLRQILINIVGNSFKYTEKGRISLRVSQTRCVGSDIRMTMFTISDTGCGILESERAKIFKRYGQSTCPTASKAKSTGLGLVLSKHLAQLLGGDVELKESRPGEGSTFVVTVDSGNLPEEPIQKFALMEKPLKKRLDGLQILVAEDTPDQALLIKFLLTDAGASVTTVNNGAAAVEQTLNNSFDVVLMDMQMPILNGLDACRIIRRQGFSRPIIALTAQALKTDTGRSLAAGCDRHVSKPFTQDRLVKTIQETLQRENRADLI